MFNKNPVATFAEMAIENLCSYAETYLRKNPRILEQLASGFAVALLKAEQKYKESPEYQITYAKEVTNKRWTALMDERHRRAAVTTYDFIDQYLTDAMYEPSKLKMWRQVTQDLIDGSVLQFGVYSGGSINALAEMLPDRTIHGFDSFVGLPQNWSYVPKGTFDLKGKVPEVRENVMLYKGWFDDTLPQWIKANSGKIAFVDIDSDIYSSASYVLEQLRDQVIINSTTRAECDLRSV